MKKKTNQTAIAARNFTRRTVVKAGLAAAAAGFTWKATGPFVRDAEAATLELSWLGWEEYNVKSFTAEFEKLHGVKVNAGFFDGNSEAYNKLRGGGTEDFDLVMADGFWPRLYAKKGLVQPIDYEKIPNIKYVFPDFVPPSYTLLREDGGDHMIASPNCWGGYGMTVNIKRVDDADSESLNLMVNEKYKGHLSTSARFEENIAMMGILAAHNLGTMNDARPDGKPFNPYVLTDAELEEVKRLLIKQKGLLLVRWNDNDTLERLLRAEAVWASPEWSGLYRRIRFDELDGKSDISLKHVLKPTEGGLGWVDTWGITSGVKSSEKLELAHKWVDFRLSRDNMSKIATEIGWSPTVDVRDMIPQRFVETMFLNQTASIKELHQFDAPSSPEKWEQVWSEVEAA